MNSRTGLHAQRAQSILGTNLRGGDELPDGPPAGVGSCEHRRRGGRVAAAGPRLILLRQLLLLALPRQRHPPMPFPHGACAGQAAAAGVVPATDTATGELPSHADWRWWRRGHAIKWSCTHCRAQRPRLLASLLALEGRLDFCRPALRFCQLRTSLNRNAAKQSNKVRPRVAGTYR